MLTVNFQRTRRQAALYVLSHSTGQQKDGEKDNMKIDMCCVDMEMTRTFALPSVMYF